MDQLMFPLKSGPSQGDLDPPSNIFPWVLLSLPSYHIKLNNNRLGEITDVPNTETHIDLAMSDKCGSRPHPHTACRQCGLNRLEMKSR